MIVCAPFSNAAVVQIATPVAGFTASEVQPAIGAPLSVKLTTPERAVLPAAAATVAVKLTDWLTVEVLLGADEISAVVVGAGFTVCVSMPLLPLKFLSLP